ncbi:hypothetical protein OQH60_08285, partial [Campylobacter sp. MIT 21-1685]|nr:hypothetical protein [Campylobacter sp. MIT 21-1685]
AGLSLDELEHKSESKDENDLADDDFIAVEEQEKELDFDDLPQDAEFLGQKDEKQDEEFKDIIPVLEEEQKLENENSKLNLSAQEQIQQELTQLDELEHNIPQENTEILESFKKTPILDEEELGIHNEELIVPNFHNNDFDDLEENDIKRALGEEIREETQQETSDFTLGQNEQNNEIVNELSQSIAGAITSSIKDETLKAALKGMNMNIHINISFNEDKH